MDKEETIRWSTRMEVNRMTLLERYLINQRRQRAALNACIETAMPSRQAPACTARGTPPARLACCRGASSRPGRMAGRRTNDLR